MTEILITISLVGLLAGFIFSMPIAGPISILVTSNALKGRIRYCHLVNIGASFAHFVYVFIAVLGLTRLYSIYQPYIPYVLFLGAVFLFYLGYKIFRTQPGLVKPAAENLSPADENHRDWRGFHTGFMISFFNPTLFLSWLTSSFFVISLVSALGLHTGGLEKKINEGIQELNLSAKKSQENAERISRMLKPDSLPGAENTTTQADEAGFPNGFPLLLSLCYAFFLSIGSILWFYNLTFFVGHYRHRINPRVVHWIIRTLGIVLLLFGFFFLYKGILMVT